MFSHFFILEGEVFIEGEISIPGYPLDHKQLAWTSILEAMMMLKKAWGKVTE